MLSKLELHDWRHTRDGLQSLTKVLSHIRMNLTPKTKYWFHLCLYLDSRGITTGQIPFDNDLRSFQLTLDLSKGDCIVDVDIGETIRIPFCQLSDKTLYEQILEHLNVLSIGLDINKPEFSELNNDLSLSKINMYRDIMVFNTNVLNRFKSSLKEETGSINLWPDHFDLAMLWFSGSKIDGEDPDDLEHAMEQINFGFSTGDNSIKEAYYYITSYPQKVDFKSLDLSQRGLCVLNRF